MRIVKGLLPPSVLSQGHGLTSGTTPDQVKVKRKCGRPRNPIPRHKRESHINAEHRRRGKIQDGFRSLKNMVPKYEPTSGRDSKADILFKAVDYSRQTQQDINVLSTEIQRLQLERDAFNQDIKGYQTTLPHVDDASGSVTSPTMDQMYLSYLQEMADSGWTFHVFSRIMQPLFEAYKAAVADQSAATFYDCITEWVANHLSFARLKDVCVVMFDCNKVADSTSRTAPSVDQCNNNRKVNNNNKKNTNNYTDDTKDSCLSFAQRCEKVLNDNQCDEHDINSTNDNFFPFIERCGFGLRGAGHHSPVGAGHSECGFDEAYRQLASGMGYSDPHSHHGVKNSTAGTDTAAATLATLHSSGDSGSSPASKQFGYRDNTRQDQQFLYDGLGDLPEPFSPKKYCSTSHYNYPYGAPKYQDNVVQGENFIRGKADNSKISINVQEDHFNQPLLRHTPPEDKSCDKTFSELVTERTLESLAEGETSILDVHLFSEATEKAPNHHLQQLSLIPSEIKADGHPFLENQHNETQIGQVGIQDKKSNNALCQPTCYDGVYDKSDCTTLQVSPGGSSIKGNNHLGSYDNTSTRHKAKDYISSEKGNIRPGSSSLLAELLSPPKPTEILRATWHAGDKPEQSSSKHTSRDSPTTNSQLRPPEVPNFLSPRGVHASHHPTHSFPNSHFTDHSLNSIVDQRNSPDDGVSSLFRPTSPYVHRPEPFHPITVQEFPSGDHLFSSYLAALSSLSNYQDITKTSHLSDIRSPDLLAPEDCLDSALMHSRLPISDSQAINHFNSFNFEHHNPVTQPTHSGVSMSCSPINPTFGVRQPLGSFMSPSPHFPIHQTPSLSLSHSINPLTLQQFQENQTPSNDPFHLPRYVHQPDVMSAPFNISPVSQVGAVSQDFSLLQRTLSSESKETPRDEWGDRFDFTVQDHSGPLMTDGALKLRSSPALDSHRLLQKRTKKAASLSRNSSSDLLSALCQEKRLCFNSEQPG